MPNSPIWIGSKPSSLTVAVKCGTLMSPVTFPLVRSAEPLNVAPFGRLIGWPSFAPVTLPLSVQFLKLNTMSGGGVVDVVTVVEELLDDDDELDDEELDDDEELELEVPVIGIEPRTTAGDGALQSKLSG